MNRFRLLAPRDLQQYALSSYFSVTRNKLGRSESEISKQEGISQPPSIVRVF